MCRLRLLARHSQNAKSLSLHALALYGQGAVVCDRELQSRQVSSVARVRAISMAGDALIIVWGRLEAARFDMRIMRQGNCKDTCCFVLGLTQGQSL